MSSKFEHVPVDPSDDPTQDAPSAEPGPEADAEPAAHPGPGAETMRVWMRNAVFTGLTVGVAIVAVGHPTTVTVSSLMMSG